MQRTRRTPLSETEPSRLPGDEPVEDLTEPADLESAGSPSSPDAPESAAESDSGSAGGVVGAAKRPRSRRLAVLFAAVGLVVLGLDQLTKALALHGLTPGEPVNVIGSLLKFNLIRNPGAAFSLGTSYTPVISAIQIVVAVGVVWLSRRLGSVGWAVAFGFLFGGAVGNIVDRIFRAPSPFHGHVVDFLQTPHWAIFNVADMAVTSAAALLVIQTLRGVHLDGTKESTKDAARSSAKDGAKDGADGSGTDSAAK
ncbi:MAG TPA: signal peptidase II [Kribbella sp.]